MKERKPYHEPYGGGEPRKQGEAFTHPRNVEGNMEDLFDEHEMQGNYERLKGKYLFPFNLAGIIFEALRRNK